MSQLSSRVRDGSIPVRWDQFFAKENLGLKETSARLEVVKIEASVIAHPTGINGIVFAWCLAINNVFAGPNDRVAPRRATGTETLRLLEEPDTHLESKIG